MKISDKEARTLLSFINKPDTSGLMVSVLGDRDTLRPTYILNRGVYNAPGRKVTASALSAVMKFDTIQLSQNRLGLARWTTSKSNPLTARVFVNQIWQEFFGRGIVRTSGDFGMQGELPTNPALIGLAGRRFYGPRLEYETACQTNCDICYLPAIGQDY